MNAPPATDPSGALAGSRADPPTLHVQRSGLPHGAGTETFVLIHGFGASSFSWRRWVPALEKLGHVVRVDLLGCGASPRPADGPYGPEGQARLVLRTLDDHGISRPTFIGHSLGGGVSLLAALELSDRGTPPRRMVIVGGAAYPQRLPPFVRLAAYPRLWRAALRDPWIGVLVAQVLRSIVADSGVVTSSLVEGYAAPLRRPGTAEALVASANHLVPFALETLPTRYATLSVRTLLVWGRQDRVVPLWVGQRLSRELPHATLQVMERCGHLPHEEDPAGTLAVLESFLSRG